MAVCILNVFPYAEFIIEIYVDEVANVVRVILEVANTNVIFRHDDDAFPVEFVLVVVSPKTELRVDVNRKFAEETHFTTCFSRKVV